MSTVRVGVIGVGHLGYHHARLYRAMPEVELVGVCDVDSVRANEVASEFETPGFDAASDLLKAGVDAVSIAAPTSAHYELTVKCLGAGVDVLVEKPIAKTSAEARDMVAAAASGGRILQVGHVERFNGAVIALREAIKRPRFVECHRLSPYSNRGDDVSVVLDLMIHDLDIVLALVQSEVISVDAVGVSVFSESEDIANARVRFASGCVANLTSSRVSMDQMRKIRIFEENAYISTDYSAQEVVLYRKKPGTLPSQAPMEGISVEPLEVKKEEPLKLELTSFIHSVRNRTPPEVDGEDGLKALELAERVITFIREHP